MYGDVVGCDGNTALVDLQGDFVARGEGGGLVDGGGVVFLDDVADVVVDGDGFLVVDAEVEVFLGLERELFCLGCIVKQDFVGHCLRYTYPAGGVFIVLSLVIPMKLHFKRPY